MGRNLGIQSSASSCSSGVVEQCGTLIFCCPFLLCRTDWRRSPKRIPFNEIFFCCCSSCLRPRCPFGMSRTATLSISPWSNSQLPVTNWRIDSKSCAKTRRRCVLAGRWMSWLVGCCWLNSIQSFTRVKKDFPISPRMLNVNTHATLHHFLTWQLNVQANNNNQLDETNK